ncbi:hypothetical protein Btru_068450 [Bulinus truncatus]|nr:hypothetical protein Btru_068450 [Bulinus truncatus]
MKAAGHRLNETIIASRFNWIPIDESYFQPFLTYDYGVCFLMKLTDDRQKHGRFYSKRNALDMILLIDPEEYIEEIQTQSGMYVTIHEAEAWPLISSEKIALKPGYDTIIKVNMSLYYTPPKYFRSMRASVLKQYVPHRIRYRGKRFIKLRIESVNPFDEIYIEIPQYTISELFADVGGLLGLFLGVSLLSLMGLLEVLIDILTLMLHRSITFIHICTFFYVNQCYYSCRQHERSMLQRRRAPRRLNTSNTTRRFLYTLPPCIICEMQLP